MTVAARQRIVRVRRNYNQWVANQMLEDYALRFTAKRARKWSSLRVANTAIGSISFLALEAIGGAITLNYGFTNAAAAVIVVGLLIFVTGLPISYYASKYGVDIDLLTRGAGFGYLGSTVTSLIYASFTFLFFALEAAIMSLALELCFGIPLAVGYVISSLLVIPLVTHGITFISRFQLWTQPIWVVLHLLPFIFIAIHGLDTLPDWTAYPGRATEQAGSFNLLAFGAAASVVFSLIAQIGEQVDFLRFLPRDKHRSRLAWWFALLSAGPGWIVLGALKLLAGSFLAVLALHHVVPLERAAEPTQMYLVGFSYVFSSPDVAIGLTGIFVIVSQLKINVTNAYAGSLAWSNFFSRLTHSHPGRVVWLVFNVAIALVLMEFGIYKALEQTLGLYSIVAVAWVGALVADLVVNKPLGLSPPHIEFKRAHLYDINPVGVGSMVTATLVAVAAFFGGLGATLQALSSFLAFLTAFLLAPLIAYATRGKYYIARQSNADWGNTETIRCCICEHGFEREDMAYCPAYAGPICSLCCSLDARCHDSCKKDGRFADQILAFLGSLLPAAIMARANSRVGHFLGVMLLLSSVVSAILALIYFQESLESEMHRTLLQAAFWKLFIILLIITGVAAWLFVLAQESRRVAQEESIRQTNLLMREIEAHKITDAELQKAKEVAEAANQAKSRYVVGISHELRTPLNAILGYAQLLEHDEAIPPHRRNAIRHVRRSAEHLSGLIDGLLDISRIEAGRLRLNRDEVRIAEFLDQLVDMFRLQSAAKGIEFTFQRINPLPALVYTDEKRFRQILINLLSNAIKFTEEGQVSLTVRYRNQVAEIDVEDTGVGILPQDQQRIFEPFERAERPRGPAIPGTGLGLTITKMLTEIMGGEISLTSDYGKGSRFRVRLLLSAVARSQLSRPSETRITGYRGARRTVLIADDEPSHRDLLHEILAPLGFILLSARDGAECIELAANSRPDLFLLDITMPEADGWAVARHLRETGHERAPIIMISANGGEERHGLQPHSFHNDYLIKPINVTQVLGKIGTWLNLEWTDDSPAPKLRSPLAALLPSQMPDRHHIEELLYLGRIGYVRGIHMKLDEIANKNAAHAAFVSSLRFHVLDFDMNQYMSALETLPRHVR